MQANYRQNVCQVAADLFEADLGLTGKIDVEISEELSKLKVGLEGVSICTGKVSFESIAIRNQYAAEFFYVRWLEEIGSFEDICWMQYCHEVFVKEVENDDKVSGRILALLGERIAVLDLAALSINRNNVFDVIFIVCAAFPYLKNIDIEGLYKLSLAQYEYTLRDVFRGHFFQQLDLALCSRIDVAVKLYEQLRVDVSEQTASLYFVCCSVLSKNDVGEFATSLLVDIQSSNRLVHLLATQALGNMLLVNQISAEETAGLTRQIEVRLTSQDSSTRDSAICAAAVAAEKMPVFDDQLSRLTHEGVAMAAKKYGELLSKVWREESRKARLENDLPAIARVLGRESLRCMYFDGLLADLLGEPGYEYLVSEALQQWIIAFPTGEKFESFEKVFPNVISRLIADKQSFSVVLASWLLSENKRIPTIAGELIGYAVDSCRLPVLEALYPPNLLHALQDSAFELLAYKTLAYVTNGPAQVTLILSMVPMNQNGPRMKFLLSAIIPEIAMDFPDKVLEGIEKLFPNSSACAIISESINEYLDKLRGLATIKELQPPSTLMLGLARYRNRIFNAARREYESQSAFLKVVTKIRVKSGRRIVSRIADGSERIITMNQVKVGFTPPRRYSIDPVGVMLRNVLYGNIRLEQ